MTFSTALEPSGVLLILKNLDLLLGATPFVLKTVRRAQLFRKRFRPSGSSPESNFLEWTSKVGSVFNGLSLLKTFNRGKPRDAAGKFIAAEPDFNASALAILAPLIHSSLVSTVTANGGDKDSVVLRENTDFVWIVKKEGKLVLCLRKH
ncbi:hypothetical protein PSTG_15831 [Puccinia striiformis f. sp. tritici PST-78]|uniref:Uncharacterized protein n=1 Tax=Puccinia striiformis f. sp. tritici PST-78 TaxID=1165861 RepID=A0A0L0UUM4_9BASI|nr:hypothetical protein PSTG_15831 [Puccinia striiformis f. sp. tritici PST-78]